MGFRGDERGQSEVIGALLIFAVIVAFIGLNQAVLVPQANEDVEFKHNNEVQRDMVDLRSGIMEAAGSNQERSRSVALGMDYPPRFIAINPPAPTGAFRTVPTDGEIKSDGQDDGFDPVQRACGISGSTHKESKFIEYRPDYNEFRNGLPMVVENTVAYRETSGKPVFNKEQSLIGENGQINIVRLVGNVDTTSSETISVDLKPSTTGGQTVNVGAGEDFTITLPTRLSNETWDNQLEQDVTPGTGKSVKIHFEDDRQYTVKCTTVGINEEPGVTPVDATADAEDIPVNSRNGEVYLKSTGSFDSDNVSVTLRNTGGEDWEISRARMPFATGDSSEADVIYEGSTIATLEVAGEFASFGGVTIPAGGEATLWFDFDGEFYPGSSQPGNGWFMITTEQTQSGNIEYRSYFVPDELDSS